MRRLVTSFLVVLFVIFAIYLVQHSYVNFDHLGKGKLASVTLACLSEDICKHSTEPIRITDKAALQKFESVFFLKVTTNLVGFTKEGLPWEITFNYQDESVTFNVGMSVENQTGYYKYAAKGHDYAFSKKDVAFLSEYID